MKAADIMTTEVISIDPEMEVSEVARLLLAHHIGAAPVVDHGGHVVGIVSEADLMCRATCPLGHRRWLSLFVDDTAAFVRRHGTRAHDVMTRNVVSIGKDATLAEIAHTLERHAIKRVPVLEAGRLVGIVSRADVLRGLASLAGPDVRGNLSDPVIRERIIDLLKEETSASLQAVSIIVLNGVVHLWGIAETEEQRAAIRVAAETVVGIDHVRDYLNTLPQVLRGI